MGTQVLMLNNAVDRAGKLLRAMSLHVVSDDFALQLVTSGAATFATTAIPDAGSSAVSATTRAITRQRDRLLLNNNGALIAAPVWATGTAYHQGQIVQYSATNPALIAACAAGTSGSSLATYTAGAAMSDGTVTWEPLGRVSCGQAAATDFVSSMYKEIPVISTASSTPGTTLINACVPGNVSNIFPAGASAAAGKIAFPVTPFIGNYGNSNIQFVTANLGNNSTSVVGGAAAGTGWGLAIGQMVEFITDCPAPQLQLSYGGYIQCYAGDPDGSNMTLIEEAPTFGPSANPSMYIITWPTGRKLRRYRFEFMGQQISNPNFAGIWIGSQDTIFAPPQLDGIIGVAIGDSYHNTDAAGGGGAGLLPYFMGQRSLKLAGVRYAQSVSLPGSGYVSGTTTFDASSANFTLPAYLAWAGANGNLSNAQYLSALTPDVVTFTIGYNDSLSSPSTIQANALASFKAARSIWPNAAIIVFSSQSGVHNGSAGQLAADVAIKAAYASWNDTNSFYFPVWLDPAGAWVSGTGHYGAASGSGNADFYVGSDSTHPPMAGHEYISQRMARLIDYALTSIGL